MDTTKKRISHVSSEAAVRARIKLQKKANAASESDDEFELHSSTQRRLAAAQGTAEPGLTTAAPPRPSRPLDRGKWCS